MHAFSINRPGLLKQIEYPVLNVAAFPGALAMLPISAVELKMIKITTCIHSNC